MARHGHVEGARCGATMLQIKGSVYRTVRYRLGCCCCCSDYGISVSQRIKGGHRRLHAEGLVFNTRHTCSGP